MNNYNYLLVIFFLLTITFATVHSYTRGTTIAIGNINQVVEAQPEAVPVEANEEKIFFVGDLMLARNVERRLVNLGLDEALSDFKTIWKDHHVVANFEAAVPQTHIPTPDFAFRFSVAKDLLPTLRQAGVTHAGLANNHTFDFGSAGYENTASSLELAGINIFGHPNYINASSSSVIKIDNINVGILGLNLIVEDSDLNNLETQVETMTANTDMQIVYIHWGNEYVKEASVHQRALATRLADLGIDVIIGHHPHVIQEIEKINHTLVFYSLGNFLFDQYFSEEVQTGLMLGLIKESDSLKIELLPVSSLDTRIKPRLLSGENRQKILTDIVKMSDPSVREEINDGVLYLPLELASSPKLVIMAR